ncbi:MAG TPA: 2TM domain-containing protein [Dermatophilaceae bacterium]|jgi:2TM domain
MPTPSNPNYDTFLTTATQIQRWRDFASHLLAYVVINTAFLIIWLAQGRGFFWPAYPLVGWAIGLSFQHFNVVIRGQITDTDVRRKLQAGRGTSPGNGGRE